MSTRLPGRKQSDILTQALGLVIALPREAAGLFGRVRWTTIDDQLQCCTVHQRSGPIRVVCSGPGLQNANRAGRWLASRQIWAIGSLGVSAGLPQSVEAGDLILADEIVQQTGEAYERVWPSDTAFSEYLYRQLQGGRLCVHFGRILSVERPVLTVQEKKGHFHGSQALAADMESAGVARAAQEAGIPFFALRAISDPADMVIPGFIPGCLDPKGGIRAGCLFRQIIKNPVRVIALFRLQRSFTLAMRHLKAAWEGPLQRVLLNGVASLERS